MTFPINFSNKYILQLQGELLPIFNKTSTKQYKAAIPTADWTDPGSSMNSAVHYKIGSGAMSTPIRTTVG